MTSPDYSSHFSLANIPFGIASSTSHPEPSAATRLLNKVIFLDVLAESGIFDSIAIPGFSPSIFSHPTLNAFAALGREVHDRVRDVLQQKLRNDGVAQKAEEDVQNVTMHLPVAVGDFTDFSCSLHHVQNAAEVVFGKRSTPPCFFNFPPAYAGRSSTIIPSGNPVTRPMGQYLDRSVEPPVVEYGASKAIDFELELGVVVGKPLERGKTLKASEADEHVFGFVLLNDWSARDIQAFEMSPLGPFCGKNFSTSISPWIIPLAALRPFTVPAPPRLQPVIPPLDDPESCNFNVTMQVEIIPSSASGSAASAAAKPVATVVGKAPIGVMYWTHRQILAHQASAGCDLRAGDLLGTGTVSGATRETFGCLMEATKGGKEALALEGGEERRYLLDGDVVRMTGLVASAKEGEGVGFGECVGQLVAART